jgi:DNA replication ATP-dependent helicase Dna2
LFNLLTAIHQAMQFADRAAQHATVQVYIWDSVTYDHLVRVVGRHLAGILQNRLLARLAWLFPPNSLVANPELSDRQSPVTVVRDVVRALVVAPVPHYYSLLNVARECHSVNTHPPYNQFRVPAFFEDPLSDQIPSARAQEIWSRAGGRVRGTFSSTTFRRLSG